MLRGKDYQCWLPVVVVGHIMFIHHCIISFLVAISEYPQNCWIFLVIYPCIPLYPTINGYAFWHLWSWSAWGPVPLALKLSPGPQIVRHQDTPWNHHEIAVKSWSYHLLLSFIISYHILSSFIIFYHLLSSFTIFYRLLSSFIIFYHLLSCFIIF